MVGLQRVAPVGGRLQPDDGKEVSQVSEDVVAGLPEPVPVVGDQTEDLDIWEQGPGSRLRRTASMNAFYMVAWEGA